MWALCGKADVLYALGRVEEARDLYQNRIQYLAIDEYAGREEPRAKVVAQAMTLICCVRVPELRKGAQTARQNVIQALSRVHERLTIYSQIQHRNVTKSQFDADINELMRELEGPAPEKFEFDVKGAPPPGRSHHVAGQQLAKPRPDALVGMLVAADFEDHIARLRTADGQSVVVSFDEELTDDVHHALRSSAGFVSEVIYDLGTSRARLVRLRAVTPAEQEFWGGVTIEQLRKMQGVEPIQDLDLIRDPELTDDEVKAFLAALES
jgi:hypothetical protein